MADDWIRADWPAPEFIVAGTTLADWSGQELPLTGRPCWLEQVHGAHVVTAAEYGEPPQADASIRGDADVICVVRTADCLPVLFCSGDGAVFGAAHAGWRGLAAGVLENTVARLGLPGGELLAWFGPAISQPAFEVGDEVRAAFIAHDANAEAHFLANSRGRWQADLYGLAAQRLASLGVTNVFGGGLCTAADEQRFYSYRRSGDAGRMVSFIGAETP